MTAPHRGSLFALTLPVALVLALAGCTSDGQPAGSGAANSPETAKAYSDCLIAEGIAGVFTDDEGYVGVSIEVGPTGATGEDGDTSFDLGSGPGSVYTAAETKCRADVPAYHPRADADDPALVAGLLKQGRAFAACARGNGLAEFPDPDAAAGGKLVVPAGTTKAQFLAVVTACATAFAAVESSTGDAGTDGDGSGGAITVSMPQFGGAYEASWSSEVTDLIFAAMDPDSTPVP
ncbi:hypothetical protein [Subtercola sp. Z020]|uniref:hypothetical protein n=1 Tax=Subtercola sp. Z020 TaxID=2080582 RepID=UPI0011B05B45|nr:hypothetical protein [Subtercola sp. Z020]